MYKFADIAGVQFKAHVLNQIISKKEEHHVLLSM